MIVSRLVGIGLCSQLLACPLAHDDPQPNRCLSDEDCFVKEGEFCGPRGRASYQPGKASQAMMPRFGTELLVAAGYENLSWYGRGPVPTYIDRDYERLGVYKSTVDREWNEWPKPQENGNKVDVRWVALTNEKGVGLLAVGSPLLSVGAVHYPKSEIEGADYSFKLSRRPQVYLNLDLRQMGVGGVDSWSENAFPLSPYRIPSGQSYSLKYRLTPVSGDFTAKAREAF